MQELKDHAVPGNITGTDAKDFSELFPVIESPAPSLRCKATGTIYPNMPPFTDRSDMLEPYWPTTQADPVEVVPATVAEPELEAVVSVEAPTAVAVKAAAKRGTNKRQPAPALTTPADDL